MMGFRYRKSVNFGPFRINMSKSGVGYSVGGGGFRTGVRSNGRKYTSMSLPGTGISYVKEGKGCMLMLIAALGVLSALICTLKSIIF